MSLIKDMIIQADLLVGLNLKVISKKNIKRYLVHRKIRINPFFWNNGILSLAISRSSSKDEALRLRNYQRLSAKKVKLEFIDDSLYFYSNFDSLSQKDAKYIYNFIKEYPRDSVGSVLYRKDTNAAFADTLGMICPFLFKFAKIHDDKEAAKLALSQFRLFRTHGFDKESQLPYHGYDISKKEKCGIIGWGRAVGWIVFGLVESMRQLDEDSDMYKELEQMLLEILNTTKKYLRRNQGYSWQLQATEGPFDMSATAMIGYAMAYLESETKNYSFRNELDIITDTIKSNIDENGKALSSSAECRGFSMYPQVYEHNSWGQAFAALYLIETA